MLPGPSAQTGLLPANTKGPSKPPPKSGGKVKVWGGSTVAQSWGAGASGPVRVGGSRPGVAVAKGVGRMNGVGVTWRAVGSGVQATKVRKEVRTAGRRAARSE